MSNLSTCCQSSFRRDLGEVGGLKLMISDDSRFIDTIIVSNIVRRIFKKSVTSTGLHLRDSRWKYLECFNDSLRIPSFRVPIYVSSYKNGTNRELYNWCLRYRDSTRMSVLAMRISNWCLVLNSAWL